MPLGDKKFDFYSNTLKLTASEAAVMLMRSQFWTVKGLTKDHYAGFDLYGKVSADPVLQAD